MDSMGFIFDLGNQLLMLVVNYNVHLQCSLQCIVEHCSTILAFLSGTGRTSLQRMFYPYP